MSKTGNLYVEVDRDNINLNSSRRKRMTLSELRITLPELISERTDELIRPR